MAGLGVKKRKIVVLGGRSVGKSSLISRFVDNEFVESYYPTIAKTYHKTVNLNGVKYQVEIIDTAGQDEYTPPNPSHSIGIHGYIFVYSIASKKSFEMIQIVYDKIVDFSGLEKGGVGCVVVGSKVDLAASRQVHRSEGEQLANKSLKGAFEEASAKDDINVSKVFELCLAEIEKKSANKIEGLAPVSQDSSQQNKGCVVM